MKTKLELIALILLFSGTCNQLMAQTLSLDSCYALALNNYPLVRQHDLIEKSREYTLSNASKAYLPQVSLTGIAGYIFGGLPVSPENSQSGDDLKLIGIGQINQTIWDGGATKTQKEIISATAKSENASVEVALYELRSRVNQLYFGILMVEEQLALLAQRRTVLDNNADRIRQMNEQGFAFKTDLEEVQVEQLKLNQQKTESSYVRRGYILMLSLLTGTEITEQTRFEKPVDYQLPLEQQIDRPELVLYQSQRKLEEARAGMQRVSLMPKVGLLGAGVVLYPEVGLGSGSVSSLGVVGLSTSWNISGLYKNSNEKYLNQLALQKIDLQEETFRFNLDLQTAQLKSNIDKQGAILDEDREIVDLTTSIREGYQIKYDNGMCSMLDLLDAAERENEAQTQMALHKMQLLMTLYEYKTQTGNQ
jgi:outer membrane protein TolC